ncbi:unnamed protein product [Rotaria sp. Silwood2]|nr:unnamed protein product [Rotaria sp. Silwood2]
MKETNPQLIKQNENFQYVSKTNKIRHLDLQYLKTCMKRKEIGQITKYLLSRNNNKTQHLFFLCISETSKICLKELNVLIKSENLLNHYFIKFINRDLYLWW